MIRLAGFPAPAGPLALRVGRGEVVLLDGPNGSGKTTLLRTLAGLCPPPPGATVEVAGGDPFRLGAADAAARLHLVPDEPRDGLVGLTVAGEFRLRGLAAPDDFTRALHRDVATLSSGEARRVALAVARLRAAPILLLDEPAEGLDADGLAALRALVAEAARRGAVVAADSSGALAGLATRHVPLAGAPAAPAPAWGPAPPGPTILEAGPELVARGSQRVASPAVALGPGLHGVTGPNGAGKSTHLLRLAGLLGGGVRVAGHPPRPGETVRLLPAPARGLFRRLRVDGELAGVPARERARFVPLELHARHPLGVSAGEAQRVALAKALGPDAAVYLLDEPEAHLDGAGRAALLGRLGALRAAGRCVVAATHDRELLSRCDSVTALGAVA